MNTAVEKLLPDNAYWKYFLQICSIPHPSGHEAALRDFLISEAKKHHLAYRVDTAGNLAIDRAAAPGCENYPSIILQAHLDMVPQTAPGVEFDFLRDPIRPIVEGDWVTTGGKTTLGADDGMGIALAMELLTAADLRCGALRGVFTVSEETGLGGAEDIDLDFLNADILFNLDSDVSFTIGCAGGSRFSASAELASAAPPEQWHCVKLHLSGMHGGHSGVDIHLPVGSAARVMGNFLSELPQVMVAEVNAGTLHNAIAREAEAVIFIAPSDLALLQQKADEYISELNRELTPEPGKKITLSIEKNSDKPEKVLTAESLQTLLKVWNALPHGLLTIAPDGSSETSSNLAVVSGKAGELWSFTLLVRSLFDNQRIAVSNQALSLLHDNGFSGEVDSEYTSWEPKWDSELLKFACSIYRQVMNREAQKFVIHGGLEPGMFCGMNPKLQMLSFAPATQAVHSPQEKLSIPDSEATRKLLRELITSIDQLNC